MQKTDFEKVKKFFEKSVDKTKKLVYNTICCHASVAKLNMREWRNWQTRTFEGRVVTPYGFKSRFSHQQKEEHYVLLFLLVCKTGNLIISHRKRSFV